MTIADVSLRRSTLRQIISEPGYAGRVISIIQRIPGLADPGEVLDLLFDATEVMGAHYAAFLSYIRGDFSHENFQFSLACDPRWCFEYKALSPYAEDPWILYAMSHTEPICASEMTGLTASQRDIVSLAVKYGMASTCVVPAPSSGALSRVGMLAIGSRYPGFFEGDGSAEFKVLARSLSMELQSWWVRFLRNEKIKEFGIKPEELQLLAFERAGMGSKQVAQELGISVESVDSRWQRLNKKLGTPNRAASARLAAEYGLI